MGELLDESDPDPRIDPASNIELAARILAGFRDRLTHPTDEAIDSLYNPTSADMVNFYGLAVAEMIEIKPWEGLREFVDWNPIGPFDPSSIKRPSVDKIFNTDFDALRGFPRGNGSNASRSDSNSSAGAMCDVGSSVSFDDVMQFMSGGVQDQSPSDRNQLVADDADKNSDGRISLSEAMGDGRGTGQMAPILLDLDGNGLEVATLGNSASFFDMTGDSLQNKTAWAGTQGVWRG